jgi:PilZ domain
MEQRKARRFDLKLPFELIRSGISTASRVGETKNVSSSGVLFKSGASLRIGEPVEYVITLPTSPTPGIQIRLRCMGKVVRVVQENAIAATLERYEFVR